MRRGWLVGILVLLAACPSARPAPQRPQPPGDGGVVVGPPAPPPPTITWKRVATTADLPPAPTAGTYQLHLIDVGTGLAVLVRGADFAMLYDAGTNDPGEKPMRVLAYLAATLGPSGDDLCVPTPPAPTQRRAIDHVVLSHPHLDHASALDLVVHCYDIPHFWDSGHINHTVFYRELLAGIAKSSSTTYHTAADVPPDSGVEVKGLAIKMPRWQRFSESDVVELGQGARFTILHANPKGGSDPNQSSVVLALELGGARVLLVGDAESGARKDPTHPVGDVEAHLIDHHAKTIRADILQVGHHGSKTSSRRGFLEAVKPKLALVSSGPKQYSRTTLPDREVLEELTRIGATVLRTDEHDSKGCPVAGRIGGDDGPGGCDSWVIEIAPAR